MGSAKALAGTFLAMGLVFRSAIGKCARREIDAADNHIFGVLADLQRRGGGEGGEDCLKNKRVNGEESECRMPAPHLLRKGVPHARNRHLVQSRVNTLEPATFGRVGAA